MTVIHIVLFKFKPTTTAAQKAALVTNLKTLKSLSCVKDQRLIVGGPSISSPITSSMGFENALVSFHESREKLVEYQHSDEHMKVVTEFLYPYKEEVVRFDFEVNEEDEAMVGVLPFLNSSAS